VRCVGLGFQLAYDVREVALEEVGHGVVPACERP
jgi:hypothetical protein